MTHGKGKPRLTLLNALVFNPALLHYMLNAKTTTKKKVQTNKHTNKSSEQYDGGKKSGIMVVSVFCVRLFCLFAFLVAK